MPNFDGVYELRFNYGVILSGRTIAHRHTIDVNLVDANPSPGETFDLITPTFRGGTPSPLDEVVEDYLTLSLALFGDEMTVNSVELWKIPEGTFDGTFLSAYVPTANVGTNAAACVAAQQTTMTFRTFGGGIMRVQWMETSYTVKTKLPFPVASAQAQAIADELVDLDTCLVGRDNEYPLFAMNLCNGENEALGRKRFRE